ncbi:hypothetical protein Clacol_006666 [Clathrus columnatus]|uniref:Mini-chromosome maintenance complex-binding protein n=1 Tax=Clathrus columnatus TaxID=1419009 RepID=A0AAV5AGY0_9AGAM|nr:hypothetical protein Clacol_006666 [Clathrus columnatus]
MVSALFNDALNDPLGVIKTFTKSEGLAYSDASHPSRIAAHFRNIFNDNDRLKQITPLNVFHPPEMHSNNALVRFRAMVQDTSISPELYPSVLSDGSPGAWGLAESTELNLNPSSLDIHSLRQREVIWAVNVPGESPFVSELLDDSVSPKITSELPHNNTSLKYRHKDPLLRTSHIGLQVKVYDALITPLKPTDIYTFVGFLTTQHISIDESSSTDVETDLAFYALHVLFVVDHSFGYTLNFSSPVDLIDQNLHRPSDALRNEIIEWIANEGLAGDRDAAVWVLLTCISKSRRPQTMGYSFSRQPAILPLSLTISKIPYPEIPIMIPPLVNVLRLLLPLFVDIPLTLSSINSQPFFPESQNEDLHSGYFQLPAGTLVLLSEFGVQEGAINDRGVRNIQALRGIVESQYLDYKFPFVPPHQFPTDLGLIVLTHGESSLFVSTHINVPLKHQKATLNGTGGVGSGCTPPGKIASFRALIRNAKMGDVQIAEGISEYIQSDFVSERQKDQKTTADDLVTWLNISRLLALSYNQTTVTVDIWNEAKELDKRRKSRLNDK